MNYSVKSVPLVILISLLHANVALAGFRLHTVKVEPTGAIPNVETNTNTVEIKTTPPAGTESATTEFVDVVAIGMGIDANSALLNAYSNAVQQALGLYVDAETLVQNDEIVRDKILTYSKGFIEEAKQVSSSQTNGLFQVKIRAKVKREELMAQAQANNVVKATAVDGASIHAQVMSQEQQQQNAQALLEKALSQFASTELDLLQAEFVGEPKVEKGSDGNTNLTYSVQFSINETAYKKSAKELMLVLDKIASNKQEFTSETSIVSTNKNWNDPNFMFVEHFDYGSKQFPRISVLTWRARNFASLRAMLYDIGSADREPVYKNFKQPQLDVYLQLLDKNEELLATTQVNSEHIEIIEKKYSGYVFIVRPYFRDEYFYPKMLRKVTIAIANEDLPNIKSARLELKLQ